MTSSFFSELEGFLETHPQYHPHTCDPNLEQELEKALTRDDLRTLGISESALFPILRSLPRKHLQTDPSMTRIKPAFRSLPDLKRLLMRKALTYLYLPHPPTHPFSMIIFTWVISDGWGDYYAQKETARLLLNAYPQLNLTLITLIHQDKQVPSNKEWNEIVIRYTGEINEPISYEPFSEALCTLITQADLILETPTPFVDILRYASQEKIVRLGEHCALVSYPYHPRTGAYSMGLHFLEVGILCKQIPLPTPFAEGMFALLSCEHYKETHTFNCAYTKTIRGTYIYLLTLCYALRDNPKDCDIYLLQMPHFSLVLDRYFKTSSSSGSHFLSLCYVKEIQLYKQDKCTVLPISSKGKKVVRLFFSEQLSQDQVRTLMSFSQHLIGCTGDQSLLEAIATGLPFFYDPPPVKRAFLKDLQKIAATRISPDLAKFFDLQLINPHLPLGEIDHGWINEEDVRICSDRLSLDEDTEEKIAISLAHLLNAPNISQDFTTLHQLLNTEYALEPFLIGLINRALIHQSHPTLAAFEKQEVEAFAMDQQNGKTTLEKMIHKLRKMKK